MELANHPRTVAQRVSCPTCDVAPGTQCETKPGVPVPGFGILNVAGFPAKTPKAHDARCVVAEVQEYREEIVNGTL